MVVVLLCIYCAKKHSRQLTFSRPEAPNTSHMCSWQFPSSTFLEWLQFLFTFFNVSDQIRIDAKMTKSKWNYTRNMIMNVSGTVCQCIHYFPSKQWLAIDPTWPALKVNNAHGSDIISWSVWILIFIFIYWILWRQSEYSQGWFLTIIDVAFECPAPKVVHINSP